MEQLREKIRAMTTSQIQESVNAIGGGKASTEETMVRAALIDVYEERKGEKAADALMQSLGMM
ncbi:MAG: hypothetical protein VBE63_15265 [Lamprobacter sp.]|uniref:hypothetical protein n=1 Tax=Lamprobacter sp. TaxID=3100796 RepID=UPI002B2578FC|nr:hypothetical protein [Lamprobacter sp.]MEA3641283.1 hypothetical protein [Lamprobacter sp.]